MSDEEPRVGPSRAEVQAKKRVGRPPKNKPAPKSEGRVRPAASPKPPKPEIETTSPDGAVRLSFSRLSKPVHYCDARPDGSVWGGKLQKGQIGVFYDPQCISVLLKAGAERASGPVHAPIEPEQQVQANCHKPADK
jgi:hypothetical protein